jgi:hypothetical protein
LGRQGAAATLDWDNASKDKAISLPGKRKKNGKRRQAKDVSGIDDGWDNCI